MLARLAGILVLLVLNGLLVSAEFSLVRARRSRLEGMSRAGDRKARIALRAVSNLSRVLSASQLGITLTSLGIGWLAESALGDVLKAWFAALPLPIELSVRVSIAAVVAMAIATFMHVVFGELAPRAVALRHAEEFARWLAPPVLVFAWLTAPFTNLLNASAQFLLRLVGQKGDLGEEPVHSPEELRILVEHSEEGGAIPHQDAQLIEGVFEFSEKNAREVMTPRTDVVAIPIDATLAEALAVVEDANFSRYPVYDGTIDNVVGLLLAKDLITALWHRTDGKAPDAPTFSVAQIMRSVHVVPGSREVEEVLSDFKRLKEHMAIVLDEFGGTAGVVTMEDLLEEIVGEILDEHDEPETRAAVLASGETLVPGEMHISAVNEHFGLAVPDEDYTTIGGFVFGALGRLPAVGDRASGGGAAFTVREMDGRRIAQLQLSKLEPSTASR